MDDATKDRYPECSRLVSVSDESQVIGEFLEWLQARYQLCTLDHYDYFQPQYPNINQLLADYYGIDLDKVESERRAMLADLRSKKEGESGDTNG